MLFFLKFLLTEILWFTILLIMASPAQNYNTMSHHQVCAVFLVNYVVTLSVLIIGILHLKVRESCSLFCHKTQRKVVRPGFELRNSVLSATVHNSFMFKPRCAY